MHDGCAVWLKKGICPQTVITKKTSGKEFIRQMSFLFFALPFAAKDCMVCRIIDALVITVTDAMYSFVFHAILPHNATGMVKVSFNFILHDGSEPVYRMYSVSDPVFPWLALR
jgi:hypothetical protein